MACATHRRILAGLDDLHARGAIDDGTRATAAACTSSECDYAIVARDADGNCVLRHP